MTFTKQSQRALPDIRRTALLATGDALAFFLFAAMGRGSHGESVDLLHVVEVALPFVVGWALVAPFSKAYQDDVTSHPRAMLARTALTWVIALPISLALRGLITQKVPPLSFAITTFIVLAVLLLGWRGVFAWFVARKKA